MITFLVVCCLMRRFLLVLIWMFVWLFDCCLFGCLTVLMICFVCAVLSLNVCVS